MAKYILTAALAFLSTASIAKDNDLKVFVEYNHGPVHVHYALPCDYNATSSLSSLKDSETSWRVEITPSEVTPQYTKNEVFSFRVVIKENEEIVTVATLINKLGESSKIVSASADGEPYELTVRPYLDKK